MIGKLPLLTLSDGQSYPSAVNGIGVVGPLNGVDAAPIIQAALNQYDDVILLPGLYTLNSQIAFNRAGQRLRGSLSHYATDRGPSGSVLKFRSGLVTGGIVMPSQSNILCDLVIDGSGSVLEGIRSTTISEIRNIIVHSCAIGLHLSDLTNSTSVTHSAFVRNNIGMLVDGLNTSIFHIDRCRFRNNASVGAQIVSGHAAEITNCIFEANGSYGLYIVDWLSGESYIDNLLFRSCWFEANANSLGVDSYQVVIDSADSINPPHNSWIQFYNCNFSLGTTLQQRALHLIRSGDVFVEKSNFHGVGDVANYFLLEAGAARTRFASNFTAGSQTPAQIQAMGNGTTWQP